MRTTLLMLLLFCMHEIKAQSPAPVYGIVKVNGEPVAGIPIQLRIEGITTVTDTKGWFRLVSAVPNDTIVIVSTAYERLVFPLGINTIMPLTLNLQPVAKAMDAVIVNTGYQTIPRERATGSFTTISKDLFNQQTGATVLSRLESITNGLYVDRSNPSNTKIVIRGISTIRGPRSPLIILNDFPYSGNLDNINPNEVESITILKDAAAASIWGTQAGNGVIVITTKKGAFNQRTHGTFSSNMLITDRPDLNNIKAFTPADNIELERFLFDKSYYNSILNTTPWVGV
jgi:TonB-dependent starch-binding outer membrane protein SusC